MDIDRGGLNTMGMKLMDIEQKYQYLVCYTAQMMCKWYVSCQILYVQSQIRSDTVYSKCLNCFFISLKQLIKPKLHCHQILIHGKAWKISGV